MEKEQIFVTTVAIGIIFVTRAELLQLWITLCDLMDCSPPDSSSAHGILQAGILEQVDMSSSKGSSPPRDQTGPFLNLLHQQAHFLPLTSPGKPSFLSYLIRKQETNPLSTCLIVAYVQFKEKGRKDMRFKKERGWKTENRKMASMSPVDFSQVPRNSLCILKV